MTLQELVKDIARLLQKSKLVDDSRISTRHLRYKVAQYRAQGIRETYIVRGEIEPIWLQPLGSIAAAEKKSVTGSQAGGVFETTPTIAPIRNSYSIFTETNSADDLSLPACNCPIGKLEIPPVVSLPGLHNMQSDNGVYRVSTASRQVKYYPITFDRFFQLEEGTSRQKHSYYFKIGHTLYISPFKEKVSVVAIWDDPLDANGLLPTDEYPLSNTLTEYIVIKILTQDFNIEAKLAADLRNDATDALIALGRMKEQA